MKFSDEKSLFPFVWLRDMSPDSATLHITPNLKARTLLLENFDTEIQPSTVELAENGEKLIIFWPCGLKSTYSVEYLHARDFGNGRIKKNREHSYMNDEKVIWDVVKIQKELPKCTFDDMSNFNLRYHDMLAGLCRYGIGLIKGIPKKPGFIREITEKYVGPSIWTYYGYSVNM